MEWTKEKPTVGGYYWFYGDGDDASSISPMLHMAFVEFQSGGLGILDFTGTSYCYVLEHYTDGYWLGPIEPPELPVLKA